MFVLSKENLVYLNESWLTPGGSQPKWVSPRGDLKRHVLCVEGSSRANGKHVGCSENKRGYEHYHVRDCCTELAW